MTSRSGGFINSPSPSSKSMTSPFPRQRCAALRGPKIPAPEQWYSRILPPSAGKSLRAEWQKTLATESGRRFARVTGARTHGDSRAAVPAETGGDFVSSY
ncbi:hypothetical protein NL676_002416 [Syzygium grande]|nr:hypothetical protein NL676_002416 [Syzygium grande]